MICALPSQPAGLGLLYPGSVEPFGASFPHGGPKDGAWESRSSASMADAENEGSTEAGLQAGEDPDRQSPAPDLDPPGDAQEVSISRLLAALRSHSDKPAAVSAAFRAVRQTPQLPGAASGSDSDSEAERLRQAPKEELPTLKDVLETLPRCRQLLDTFRASPNTQNKTPLAILHEYSSRFNLECSFEEETETSLGPFTSTAKLTSVRGAVLYGTGRGRGRGKKGAKQLAAAALLEELLATVDSAEFLLPSKQPKHLQSRMPYPGALPSSRLAPRSMGRRLPRGRQAFMQGLARGSQVAYAAGYDLGSTLGMQLRPPGPGSYPGSYAGLQQQQHPQQPLGAAMRPLDMGPPLSQLRNPLPYEQAQSPQLQGLLGQQTSPVTLGLPQLDLGSTVLPPAAYRDQGYSGPLAGYHSQLQQPLHMQQGHLAPSPPLQGSPHLGGAHLQQHLQGQLPHERLDLGHHSASSPLRSLDNPYGL